MDAQFAEKMDGIMQSLKAVAEAAAEAQHREMDGRTVPRYSEIELYAHSVGQQVSRLVQELLMERVAQQQGPKAECPSCKKMCGVTIQRREVQSIDGPVQMCEPTAYCSRCERTFFPSAEEFRTDESESDADGH